MKTLFKTLVIVTAVILIIFEKTHAQCTATISGDTCINALLTAGFSDVADTVKWYRDGALLQVRVKRNPAYTIVAGTDNGLYEPKDMFVDGEGNMYIVDGVLYGVVKYASGSAQGVIVAGGNGKGTALNQFFSPQSVAVDADGNLYVSDALMNRVTKWAPGATSGIVVAGGNGEGSAANQLNGPQNICLDASGNIYIADRWNNRIQKWLPGAVSGITVAGGNGSGAGNSQLSEPLDVAVDAADNVYVVDYWNNRVQKWSPGATSGITVAGGNGTGSLANQLNFTTALSITGDGALYIRDQGNYRIQKWIPGNAEGITVAGGNGYGDAATQMGWGFGLYVDDEENIYVPELFLDRVDKFVPATVADMQFFATATGKYTATVTGENGCSAQSPLFSVNTFPAQPAAIKGPKFVSAGQQGIIYYVQRVKGLTYNWTVPPDATITAGQGKFAIRVNWGFSDGQVTVTAANGCGASLPGIRRVRVSFAAAEVAGQIQNATGSEAGISLYPNPATNIINLKSGKLLDRKQLYITDIAGKVFACKWATANSLNIEGLQTGIYFLHTGSSVIKFAVLH